MVTMSVACGDESPPSIDAGNTQGHDAAPGDGSPSVDSGTVDIDAAQTIDAATTDAPVVVDAGTTPDASPDGSTQNAMWRGAQSLESLAGSGRVPVAGMDGAGRAFVAWINDIQDPENENRFYGEVRVSRFDAATGWSEAMALSPAPSAASFAWNLHLAVGPSGDAMAIWNQYNGTNNVDVMVRRFTPTGGWAPATVLFDATTSSWASGNPKVAIAGDGSAVALWSQRGGDLNLDSLLYASHFTPVDGWQPAVLVHAVPSGDAIVDDVATDAHGNAVAVWTLHLTGGSMYASRFSGTTWSTPVRIDDGARAAGGFDFSSPSVAVDAAGNAVAVFESWENNDVHGIWATRGTPDGTWQSATRLEDPALYANMSDVACDAMGNAIAVWQSWPGAFEGAMPTVRASRFSPSGGWGPVIPIETSADTSASPQVAMTPTGTATVAFIMGQGIWANRYANVGTAGNSWGAPVPISSTGAGGYDPPTVAAGGLDSAIAAWPFNPMPVDGHPTPFDVWANVYR